MSGRKGAIYKNQSIAERGGNRGGRFWVCGYRRKQVWEDREEMESTWVFKEGDKNPRKEEGEGRNQKGKGNGQNRILLWGYCQRLEKRRR